MRNIHNGHQSGSRDKRCACSVRLPPPCFSKRHYKYAGYTDLLDTRNSSDKQCSAASMKYDSSIRKNRMFGTPPDTRLREPSVCNIVFFGGPNKRVRITSEPRQDVCNAVNVTIPYHFDTYHTVIRAKPTKSTAGAYCVIDLSALFVRGIPIFRIQRYPLQLRVGHTSKPTSACR